MIIHLYCYLVVFISYAPQLYVIYTSFQNTSGKLFTKGYSLKSYTEAFSKVGNAIQNTFFIGGLAGTALGYGIANNNQINNNGYYQPYPVYPVYPLYPNYPIENNYYY